MHMPFAMLLMLVFVCQPGADEQVDIGGKLPDRAVENRRLPITDNDEVILEKVFEPYFTTKFMAEGTGGRVTLMFK
jgi:hypothetical protein